MTTLLLGLRIGTSKYEVYETTGADDLWSIDAGICTCDTTEPSSESHEVGESFIDPKLTESIVAHYVLR